MKVKIVLKVMNEMEKSEFRRYSKHAYLLAWIRVDEKIVNNHLDEIEIDEMNEMRS